MDANLKKQLIAEKFEDILRLLELDLSDPSLAKTPMRIARMYVDEVFAGLDSKISPSLIEGPHPKELILIKNIPFLSFCEHHFVPFVGKVHIGYYPSQYLMGLGSVTEIVRHFAKRPQLQERLTSQIADCFSKYLDTDDIAVAIEATHFCVVAQGKEQQAELETHLLKGCFEKDPGVRLEFFSSYSEKGKARSK